MKLRSAPFWAQALLLGLLLAAVEHAPVFLGRTPLAAEIVINFPPWNEVRGGPQVVLPHAELGDSITQFYPWRMFAHSAYRQGVLPAWNPHLLLGTPFVANSTSAVFYPIHALYLVLPPNAGWALAALIRTALAVLFAALLAREAGASTAGSLAAGVIFAHCGFMVAWQAWPQADAALWLPLALYGVHRLRFRPSPRAVAITGAAFAMPVLAGHPEIAVYVTLAGIAFWAFCLLLPPGEGEGAAPRPRYVLLFAAAGILALGLAAVQMLPTLEWVGEISRSTHATWNRKRPLPELVSFISRHARAPRNPLGIPIPEAATYAGILALLAAPLAFASRRKAMPAFFLLLLATAAQVVYGFGPAYRLSLITPIFKSFPNNRLILLMDLSLAILTALGLTAVQQKIAPPAVPAEDLSKNTWRALAAGAVLVPSSLLAFATARSRPDWNAALGGPFGLLSSWLLLAAGVLLLGLAAFRFRLLSRRAFGVCALLLLAADLSSFAWGHVPSFPAHRIFPEPPVFRFLRTSDPGPFRVATLDVVAPPNAEMAFGLASPAGYDFSLRRAQGLIGPFTSVPESGLGGSFLSARVIALDDSRLDLMNVKYLMTSRANQSTANLEARPDRFRQVYDDGAVQVFRNLRALPRAFLVPLRGARTLPDEESVLARLQSPEFDPVSEVLLTAGSPLPPSPPAGSAAGPSGVTGIETGLSRTRVSATVAEPSILVLGESDYPGWTVLVDDRRERLLRVDFAFKGVVLGPGEHRVEFVFESPTLRAGLALSAAALVVLVALCAWPRRRPPDLLSFRSS